MSNKLYRDLLQGYREIAIDIGASSDVIKLIDEYIGEHEMKERFEQAFNDMLTANVVGEVRNLLITDDDAEFLDDALYALRNWVLKNGVNLVELDEKYDSWFSDIQSRELFDKLNQPNTVLLIKNYAKVSHMRGDDNTARSFLRDAVVNRHYGCGNDFAPSDDLLNLKFVVVLNDLSEMKWHSDEYMTFSVIHQDNTKKVWTNKNSTLMSSKMHPVMSAVNKVKFWVSDDETTLCIDVGEAFKGIRFRKPIGHLTVNDRTEMIHTYIESNLPDFNERVVCLILKMDRFSEEEHFVIDGRRIRKSFPNLGCVCCKDTFEIADVDDLSMLDPFELGELCFNLAQDGDAPMANLFVRDLWALDPKWARFFREVARDYYRKPEDHAKFETDGAVYSQTGMDHLFHIYMFGWYYDKGDKVLVAKHKNSEKAIDLLPVRFQNCSIEEVMDKLCWDYQIVKNDKVPDYDLFTAVVAEADSYFPGVLAKMRENGWLNNEA